MQKCVLCLPRKHFAMQHCVGSFRSPTHPPFSFVLCVFVWSRVIMSYMCCTYHAVCKNVDSKSVRKHACLPSSFCQVSFYLTICSPIIFLKITWFALCLNKTSLYIHTYLIFNVRFWMTRQADFYSFIIMSSCTINTSVHTSVQSAALDCFVNIPRRDNTF